ncbi:MAG: glycosyltransferase, partial [Alphaproteobacteria bacterium]|nr:glycosyltransferase [Alphaproteobacteria bacterium]
KSGPREILLNGMAGILFPVGDHKKLATVMTKIAGNKYDAAKMIKTATLNLERFNPKNIVAQFLTLIKDNK